MLDKSNFLILSLVYLWYESLVCRFSVDFGRNYCR